MLAAQHPEIYAVVGVHPHDAAGVTPRAWEGLRLLAGETKVVGLGETGLDFFRDLSPRSVQRQVFRRQLELALELQLPVVIHDRDAHAETLAILKEHPGLAAVVLHCFSGDRRMADECLALGCYLGIDGPLTYPKILNWPKSSAAPPWINCCWRPIAPTWLPSAGAASATSPPT